MSSSTSSSSNTPERASSDTTPAGLKRRTVLRAGALAGAAVGTTALAGQAATASANAGGGGGAPAAGGHAVFQHGVASGDPMADRVILWTRVTPTPEATPGSGVGDVVVVEKTMPTGAPAQLDPSLAKRTSGRIPSVRCSERAPSSRSAGRGEPQ